jgi:Domain of unknown function (DUF4259)
MLKRRWLLLTSLRDCKVDSDNKMPTLTESTDGVKDVKVKPSKELVEKARRSIARILTDPSELLGLWRESEAFDSWKSCVQGLSNCL